MTDAPFTDTERRTLEWLMRIEHADDGTVFVITDDLIRHDFDDEEMAEVFVQGEMEQC